MQNMSVTTDLEGPDPSDTLAPPGLESPMTPSPRGRNGGPDGNRSDRHKLGWLSRHRVRRALRGEQLACGCVVGVYELYSGSILSVIDVRAPQCGDRRHQAHIVIATDTASAGAGSCSDRHMTTDAGVPAEDLGLSTDTVEARPEE